jgi:Na+/melibiose symporter-like transporter
MDGGLKAEIEPAAATESPRLDRKTMFLYATGSISNGIKLRGMSGFLMLFYNQVVGLPAAWVGAALMVALILDGIIDPAVGLMSDNTPTRWGRRHPYMYASALPYALAFYLIWNPPLGWSNELLLVYMAATVISVRVFDSLFEVPVSALIPELTSDYHQRTELVSYRYLMGILGGMLMSLYAYKVIFKKDADNPEGLLGVAGYHTYGLISAIAIFVAIMIAALGTHHRIKWLHRAPKRKFNLREVFGEVLGTLSTRELWVLTAAGIFAAVASGVAEGLSMYFNVYFWELDPSQLAILVMAGLSAALVAIPAAPFLCRRVGKRATAGFGLSLAFIVALTPVALRLMGVMPPNGSKALLYILIVEVFIHAALVLIANIAVTSMFTDLTEASQVRTGRRSEGLLVSADNFLKKVSNGAGLFVSGAIITLVAFPAKAKPGAVDQETLNALALVYIPTLVVLYVLSVASLSFYKLTQQAHEQNLETIRQRGAA